MPVLVSFASPSLWTSCQTITRNLAEAYRHAFPDWQTYHVPRDFLSGPGLWSKVADDIYRLKPDRIVLTDDPSPHPLPLIEALHHRFGTAMPPLYIHVYGDFVIGASYWQALEERLKGKKVSFICSSPRHADMLSHLVPGGLIEMCPFPLRAETFRFDPEARRSARAEYGLGVNDRLFVYTGRMTYQKNVICLIQHFVDLLRQEGPPAHLFLAGGFDHLGGPYEPGPPIPGLFFHDYQTALQGVPEALAGRIRYLGHLEPQDLHPLYNAADCFVSLSTFHDEDFGMAPAEALMTGCRAILSDWGGYPGFDMKNDSVTLAPVRIDENGLYLDSQRIIAALTSVAGAADCDSNRKARSQAFASRFSIAGVAEQLRVLHQEPVGVFGGYSNTMRDLGVRVEAYHQLAKAVFFDGMGAHSFYHDLYGCYMGSKRAVR